MFDAIHVFDSRMNVCSGPLFPISLVMNEAREARRNEQRKEEFYDSLAEQRKP